MRLWCHLQVMLLVLCLPAAIWACDYPAPLRALSATLVSVQDASGQVGTYHRARLARALAQTTPSMLMRGLKSVLGRADLRAATTVFEVSAKLASGTGRTLDAYQAEQVNHLARAIRTSCKANTLTRAPNSQPTASTEQRAPQPGKGQAALTFRQGLARLSLAFTIYMTFLACVIGVRRQMKGISRMPRPEKLPPPGGHAPSSPKASDTRQT